jgi:hypothetical protein
LTAGALLAPAGAWAQGRILFTDMTIQKCEDFAACEWKLTCTAGGGQPVDVVDGASGKAARTVKLGHALDVRSFPVTLRCTLFEDDGIFGASWEEAGEASVDLPSGGSFKIDLGNKDQGGVRVKLVVDSLEIAIAAPPPAAAPAPDPKAKAKAKKTTAKPAAPLQLLGVFNPREEGQAVVIGLESEAFKARVDELGAKGIKPLSLDTFEDGGKRLWSGIFRSAQDRAILLHGLEWDDFLAQWKRLSNGNMRLVDLEIYQEGGKTRFTGLYRQGSDSYSLWVGQDRPSFLAKCKELAALKGMYVNDLELYQPGSKVLYAGAFRTATSEPEIWANLERAAFEAKWQEAKGKGQQVSDVETYRDGGKRFYDATVVKQTAGEVGLGLDQAAFAKRWRELLDKGLRLVDLEAYRE